MLKYFFILHFVERTDEIKGNVNFSILCENMWLKKPRFNEIILAFLKTKKRINGIFLRKLGTYFGIKVIMESF